MLGNPGEVFFASGGVNNEAEEVFGKVIDNQVIYHAARGVKHTGIKSLAGFRELCHIVRQQITQELPSATAAQIDDGHVRHIKHSGIGANRMVFIELRTIMQRHHPAVEIDHARAA